MVVKVPRSCDHNIFRTHDVEQVLFLYMLQKVVAAFVPGEDSGRKYNGLSRLGEIKDMAGIGLLDLFLSKRIQDFLEILLW